MLQEATKTTYTGNPSSAAGWISLLAAPPPLPLATPRWQRPQPRRWCGENSQWTSGGVGRTHGGHQVVWGELVVDTG
jgi:hypothetical protein